MWFATAGCFDERPAVAFATAPARRVIAQQRGFSPGPKRRVEAQVRVDEPDATGDEPATERCSVI